MSVIFGIYHFYFWCTKTKVPTDRFAFNVAKGSTFENVTVPTPKVVIVGVQPNVKMEVSKNITLKIPNSEKTFLVSNAQYELLMEVIQVSSIQVLVNLRNEMIAYVEIQ